MPIDACALKDLIETEIAKLADSRSEQHIRSLLVEPTPAPRDWDYGEPGQQYIFWAVLEHPASNTVIGYCEEGFGPSAPWGFLFLSGEYSSLGMDSQWYTTFLQTFFVSGVANELPIWRVFKTEVSGERKAISGEAAWDETWTLVRAYRQADAVSEYECDNSLAYDRD